MLKKGTYNDYPWVKLKWPNTKESKWQGDNTTDGQSPFFACHCHSKPKQQVKFRIEKKKNVQIEKTFNKARDKIYIYTFSQGVMKYGRTNVGHLQKQLK